jgi:membrane protein implicated in regulation of membrane protease activity
MTTAKRYWLLQIPGWVLVALVLVAVRRWIEYPWWVVVLILGLDVAKDAVLYPFLRRAYETGTPTVADQLVGQRGVAKQLLAPEGYVFVRGELWKAQVESGHEPIESGEAVLVQVVEGMKLTVTRAKR